VRATWCAPAHNLLAATAAAAQLPAPCATFSLQAGSLTYHYVDDFTAAAADLEASNGHRYTPKYKQWVVYSLCLRDYGARHRHMGGWVGGRVGGPGVGWVGHSVRGGSVCGAVEGSSSLLSRMFPAVTHPAAPPCTPPPPACLSVCLPACLPACSVY
jgi:hypothetical protein